jgi:hypothetical protein
MLTRKFVTNRVLIAACLAVPFAIASTFHRDTSLTDNATSISTAIAQSPVADTYKIPSVDKAEAGRRMLEQAAARTRETQRLELATQAEAPRPPPPPTQTRARHDRLIVRAVEQSVVDMLAVQGLYNAETSRKRAMEEILASPHKLAVFEDAIKDEVYAKSTFGNLQAETRYFASQALQKAARDGDEEPLIRVVKAIGGAASNGLSAGQKQDLEELLLGWARSKEPAFFETATDALPAALGFNVALPEDVRALYKDSVYMALYRRVGMGRAQQAVDRLFPS